MPRTPGTTRRRHIDSARECEPWVVSRSGWRTRSLPVLGRQGLVGSNLAQSERTSTNARSCRWRDAAARRPALRAGWTAHVRQGGQPAYGSGGQPAYGQGAQPGYGQNYGGAYANYQELEKKKSPIGWWIAGAALVIVIIVVAVLAIRAVTGGDTGTAGGPVSATLAGRLPAAKHSKP